jgi:hypothetical protein
MILAQRITKWFGTNFPMEIWWSEANKGSTRPVSLLKVSLKGNKKLLQFSTAARVNFGWVWTTQLPLTRKSWSMPSVLLLAELELFKSQYRLIQLQILCLQGGTRWTSQAVSNITLKETTPPAFNSQFHRTYFHEIIRLNAMGESMDKLNLWSLQENFKGLVPFLLHQYWSRILPRILQITTCQV